MEKTFIRSGGRIISHNPTGPQPRPGSQITIDEDIYISKDRGYIAGDLIPGGLYTAEELLEIMKREFDNPSDTVQIVVTASPINGGFVTSSYTYDKGTEVMLQASADNWFEFDHWSIGGDSETVTCIADTDKTIIAYFKQIPHVKLSLSANPFNAYKTLTGAGDYDLNTPINISTSPKPHFHFINWNDGNSEMDRTLVFTSECEVIYTAYFYEDPKAMVTTSSVGWGSVVGAGEYYIGETAMLTAVPDPGQIFKHWDDDKADTRNPLPILVEQDIHKVAHFEIAPGECEAAVIDSDKWGKTYPAKDSQTTEMRTWAYIQFTEAGPSTTLQFHTATPDDPEHYENMPRFWFACPEYAWDNRHATQLSDIACELDIKYEDDRGRVIEHYQEQCEKSRLYVPIDRQWYTSYITPVLDEGLKINFTFTVTFIRED